MRIAGALLLAVILVAGQAVAVPVAAPAGTVVQAPQWVVGSEWYYSDGYALKVTSATPQSAVFDRIDAPGQWFSREGFIRKDSASADATRNAIYRTIGDREGFALQAGKPLTFQREYLSNGKLMVHASSWTVEGRETITVPAGTFDCWLLVWRTRSLKSDWTGFERWWYSPQAQHYVRMEYKYGPGAEGSRVLMRYHVGPAVPPRAEAASPVPAPLAQAPIAAPTPLVTRAASPKPAVVVAAEAPVVTIEGPGSAAEQPPRSAEPVAAQPPPRVPVKEKPAAEKAAATRKASHAAPVDLPASVGGAWHAQVGSSKDVTAMRISLQKTLAANPQLSALPSGIAAHPVAGRGTFYRAWVGQFEKAGDAKAVCDSLLGKGPGCAVFKAETREASNR